MLKFLPLIALAAIAYVPIFGPISDEPIRDSYIIGLCVSSLAIASFYWRKISPIAGIITGYFLVYSSVMSYLPWVMLPNFGQEMINSMQSIIAGFSFFFLALTLPFLMFKAEKTVIQAFIWLVPINACVMIFNYFHLKFGTYVGNPAIGMLLNSSLDANFLVCMMPLIFKDWKMFKLSFIPMFVAVLISGSATAQVLMAVYFIYKLISKKGFSIGQAWAMGLVPFASLMTFYELNFGKVNGGSGRYWIWQISWDFIIHHFGWVIGTGPGTFWMYGPILQLNDMAQKGHPLLAGQKFDSFLMLHNDFYQVLFEFGIPGLLLVLLFYFSTVKKAKGENRESIIMLGIMALCHFPAHHYMSALFLCALTKDIYSEHQLMKQTIKTKRTKYAKTATIISWPSFLRKLASHLAPPRNSNG